MRFWWSPVARTCFSCHQLHFTHLAYIVVDNHLVFVHVKGYNVKPYGIFSKNRSCDAYRVKIETAKQHAGSLVIHAGQ